MNTQTQTQLLETKRAEAAKRIEDRKAELKQQMELRRLDSESNIVREIVKQDAQTLDAYFATFSEPEYVEDCKPGTKFNLRQVFGYGNQVDKLLTLVRTIQYAKAELKAKMLEDTGLTDDLLEDISDALGSTPYFSEQIMDITPAIEPDLDELKELLSYMAETIGLVNPVKMNKLTEKDMEDLYKYREAKAKLDMENTIAYLKASQKGSKSGEFSYDA